MVALVIAIIFFVISDRALKILALKRILPTFDLPGDFFKFNYQPNYQIAFSLPLAGRFVAAIIFIIIFMLISYFVQLLHRNKTAKAGWLMLIIFGAASNLFDRLKYGYVIDYLDLKYFTVFNLADVMIVAGVVGLLINYKMKLHYEI